MAPSDDTALYQQNITVCWKSRKKKTYFSDMLQPIKTKTCTSEIPNFQNKKLIKLKSQLSFIYLSFNLFIFLSEKWSNSCSIKRLWQQFIQEFKVKIYCFPW